MKKVLSLLWTFLCFAALPVMAQVVTTTPVTVTQSTKGITITFHADGGNRGMMGVASTTPVYAHTGVITSASKDNTDWKHASDWNTNDPKYKMTYVKANTWKLDIPDIRTFYGITDASEQVKQLVFVFRTGDRSKEAKNATGANIVVEVFPDGFPSSTAKSYPGGTPEMGPVTNADGTVTFCLGAPEKTNVLLVGSWNNYAVTPSQLMNYQDKDGVRYFWTNVAGLNDGKDYIYYYIIDGAIQNGDPYGHLVLDPWNDKSIPSTVFPNLPAYPTSQLTDVPVTVYNSARESYDWTVKDFKGVKQSDLLIYEILIRDFAGTNAQAKGDGTVNRIMQPVQALTRLGYDSPLDYIKGLGVNAIELMPVMEFSGNNSWGYNPNFYFAPDKAYGTPDDYKRLIDEAHKRGLAVILDVVFNQSDNMHPWYNMYSQTSPCRFFNGSAPHDYNVFNDWNQDYDLVHRQWCDVLDYWMTEYKVDGFRFDLVKGLGDSNSYGTAYNAATNTYATPSAANTDKYNATRVKRMKALRDHIILTNPDAYFINEDLATAQEENEMAADGEINWANINNAACEYAMGYLNNASLDRFYAPLDGDRTWGSTVSYAESHDEERVAYKARTYGVTEVKKNIETLTRRLGSLAAQMIIAPGAHMIWQFEELGADQSTKSSNGDNNTSPKKVLWSNLSNENYAGLFQTYASICAVRSAYPYMFGKDAACKVSLSSQTARYISLASGDSELYLVVNPAVTGSAIVMPYHAKTGAAVNLADGYELLASSYNTTPTATSKGVELLGGGFAIYGKSLQSGIDDIIMPESGKRPEVDVTDGIIIPRGEYTTFTIHSLAGMSMPVGSQLAPGLYIVTVDGSSVKVSVR